MGCFTPGFLSPGGHTYNDLSILGRLGWFFLRPSLYGLAVVYKQYLRQPPPLFHLSWPFYLSPLPLLWFIWLLLLLFVCVFEYSHACVCVCVCTHIYVEATSGSPPAVTWDVLVRFGWLVS